MNTAIEQFATKVAAMRARSSLYPRLFKCARPITRLYTRKRSLGNRSSHGNSSGHYLPSYTSTSYNAFLFLYLATRYPISPARHSQRDYSPGLGRSYGVPVSFSIYTDPFSTQTFTIQPRGSSLDFIHHDHPSHPPPDRKRGRLRHLYLYINSHMSVCQCKPGNTYRNFHSVLRHTYPPSSEAWETGPFISLY